MGKKLRLSYHIDKDEVISRNIKTIGLDTLYMVFKFKNKKSIVINSSMLEYKHHTVPTLPYININLGVKKLIINLGIDSIHLINEKYVYYKIPTGYIVKFNPIYCLDNKLQDSIENLMLKITEKCKIPKHRLIVKNYIKNSIDENAVDLNWLREVVAESPIIKNSNNKVILQYYELFEKVFDNITKLMKGVSHEKH